MFYLKVPFLLKLLLACTFLSNNVFSQKINFLDYERRLLEVAPLLANGQNDIEKRQAHDDFLNLWDEVIDHPKSMKFPFDSLKLYVPILTSKNKKLRIINWYTPLENGIYNYYAIVQYYDSKGNYQVKRLDPIQGEVKNSNSLKLTDNQWIGALYYHMSSFKRGKKTYYLLLGWDGHNERSNKKIMDVLSISKTIVFGAPIFRYKKQRLHRFILEYKEDAAVSVRFSEKKQSIFFPKLIPIDDNFEGLYDYYVPDGSINAFELINGSFKFKENVENPFKVTLPKIKKIDKGLFSE
ncbi:MAG: hypothetical protein VXY06_04350 [Bacteroidota bacterium]|nr:hypothetical protein [Bacteroidota bacterium]MEE3037701.1 hypothetical protein [Bacteroidota bacterium]